MPENLRKESTAWVASQDMFTIAKLCKRFNQGRIYEIFGEYCGLTSHILKERQARGWLHYENGKIDGFALGKHKQSIAGVHDVFAFEEIWIPCDGISTEVGQPRKNDLTRVHRFRELINSLGNFPLILRAAVDNHFAHLVSRVLQADWVNGLVLAQKTLDGKTDFSVPMEYRFRIFELGDQYYMSKIHKEVFDEVLSPEDYKSWATAENCRTIVATKNRRTAGFIIAEKRHCGSFGDFIIAVKPAHQCKGIGTALLKAAFNVFVDMKVRKVIADYLMLNVPAHSLYYKHKFKPKRIYNYFLYDPSHGKGMISVRMPREEANP